MKKCLKYLILFLSISLVYISSGIFHRNMDKENYLLMEGRNNRISPEGITALQSLLYADTDIKKDETVLLDKDFFSALDNTDPIKRDFYLDGLINKIFQGRGYIELVDRLRRYKKKFRIVIIDSDVANLNIRYNLFTDKEDYLELLKRSDLFEFKGQFIIYTPLSSKKDSYIFDIILSEGALVVK